MPYYSNEELRQMGFKYIGKNVKISTKASIYNTELIEIGDNSRIDDFCVISGKVKLGRNVHISPLCLIAGGMEGVTIEDFTGLAYGVKVFTRSDDYSGETLSNPTVPEKFRKTFKASVVIKRHCHIGAGAVILPGVTLEEGTSVGALTLVDKSTQPWGIYVGIPARRIGERKKDLLKLEKLYLMEEGVELTNDVDVQAISEDSDDNNRQVVRVSITNVQELEAKLLEIGREIFEKEIGLHDKREEISGWDSFAHLLLVTRVEEELGLVIPTEEVSKIHCLKDFLRFVG